MLLLLFPSQLDSWRECWSAQVRRLRGTGVKESQVCVRRARQVGERLGAGERRVCGRREGQVF